MNALLYRFLGRTIKSGTLEVIDAGGRLTRFGDGRGDPVRVRFATPEAERSLLANLPLKLGEEFVDAGYVMEAGRVYDFLALLLANVNESYGRQWAAAVPRDHSAPLGLKITNTEERARENIARHYDLDKRLFSLFLDRDFQYSCGYFEDEGASLDDAQLAKKRHVAAKLALKPGQRVLDIGSGWGGLSLYLAEQADVEVVGVTLSEQQFAVSNARAVERGLEDRVRFLLKDYRNLEGSFDRIVSVGMFEHVGSEHYREFFAQCHHLLGPNGVMVLHSIVRSDGPGEVNPWIRKYIFPGSQVPALSEVVPEIERAALIVTDIEILRLHYARTLRAWRERFLARREEARALYDERFCRMWEFYLAAGEASFRFQGLMNFQIQMVKDIEALPLTRKYMAGAEESLRSRDG